MSIGPAQPQGDQSPKHVEGQQDFDVLEQGAHGELRLKVRDKITLELSKSDIVSQEADILVNATDESLDHFNGLAKNMVEKGGTKINHASRQLIQYYGHLPLTGCCFTHPGNLKCERLVHAVSPQWNSENPQESQQILKSTILNILQMSMHLNAKTIAMPPIAAGAAGFPPEVVAQIFIETCSNWASLKDTGGVEEIKVCIFDTATEDAFRRVFHRFVVEV